jgi:omega-6 fatty acid desaturase (delta-12 desaturase)
VLPNLGGRYSGARQFPKPGACERASCEVSIPSDLQIPSRRELIREFVSFAVSDTAHGLRLFAFDIVFYAAAIAGVLFLPDLWMKIVSSIVAGTGQAKLLSLAHDAAHGSLTESKRLNWILGVVAFTLFHYNYRLWVFEHHRLHHPNTNDPHPDAHTPYSKDAYDKLPAIRRWLERFYRAPNIVGWGTYYVLQRYWWTKIISPQYVPDALRRSALKHSCLLLGYLGVFLAALLAAPLYATNLGSIGAVILGLLLPFFVFEIQNSFAIYVQHTDPRIPWFKGEVDRSGIGRTELISVDLATPQLMAWFYHDIFAHPVHHLYPKIPCYKLREAQDHLNKLLGPAAVVRTLGLEWWLDTMGRCKLYDWDEHRWLDFDGRPTTERLVGVRPPTMLTQSQTAEQIRRNVQRG